MLQRGLRLHSHGASKHGPCGRAHSRARTQNQPASATKGSPDGARHERTAGNTAPAPAKGSTSLGFGKKKEKKMFHAPPVSLVIRSGGSRGSASTYRVQSEGGWVKEAAPSMALSISTLSSPPRRVIAVAHSRRVLATDPCWHSFSQRHVTASQHSSEARVPLRGADWPSAAEARPKRSALIGRRSINSDCHVLMKARSTMRPCDGGGPTEPGGCHSQG